MQFIYFIHTFIFLEFSGKFKLNNHYVLNFEWILINFILLTNKLIAISFSNKIYIIIIYNKNVVL